MKLSVCRIWIGFWNEIVGLGLDLKNLNPFISAIYFRHIRALSLTDSSAVLSMTTETSPYLFCSTNSCTFNKHITRKRKFACALHVHPHLLCSLASSIRQGRNKWGQGGRSDPGAESLREVPKSPNNVACTFFNTVHLLPKDLRFEHTWGRQTCFFPRAPSTLGTPLGSGTPGGTPLQPQTRDDHGEQKCGSGLLPEFAFVSSRAGAGSGVNAKACLARSQSNFLKDSH